MNLSINYYAVGLMAPIEQLGLPALRIAFTIAVLSALCVGFVILRRRHEFFDRDPKVENDVPVVRHNRAEEILFVWSGLTLVLLFIAYEVWTT
jgi:hypothetical protein